MVEVHPEKSKSGKYSGAYIREVISVKHVFCLSLHWFLICEILKG